MAKEFLSSRDIAFEERNVRGDDAALRELVEDYHGGQTPTIVIDDRVIIGFNPEECEAAIRSIQP